MRHLISWLGAAAALLAAEDGAALARGFGAGGFRGGTMGSFRGGTVVGVHGGGAAVRLPGGGAVVGGHRGGAVVGPGGAVVGSRTVGGVVRPGGGLVGVNPRGVLLPGPRPPVGGEVVVRGRPIGTRYISPAALSARGTAFRARFRPGPWFTPAWYARYPLAWRPGRWVVPSIWVVPTWPVVATWAGYTGPPVYFDFGNNVVYENNQVFYSGQPVASAEEYAQQAATLADRGAQATPAADDQWRPLGVFALVQGEEDKENRADNVFQLAVNKDGIIRGNYYDPQTDTTLPVQGSVGRKTQRAAWTVGDKKEPVFEAGIYNLTREQTPVLVHFGGARTEQWLLVRLEAPKE